MISEDSKTSRWLECGGATPRQRRNTAMLVGAFFLWAIGFLGATWAITEGIFPGSLSWAIAAVPIILGIVVLFSYRRFLRESDELQRQIQLEALALGLGVGWVAISGYPLFERLGAPAMDSGDYVLIIALAYSFGSILGWRKYR